MIVGANNTHALGMLQRCYCGMLALSAIMTVMLTPTWAVDSEESVPSSVAFEQTGAPEWKLPDIPLRQLPDDGMGTDAREDMSDQTASSDIYDESGWEYSEVSSEQPHSQVVPSQSAAPAREVDPIMEALRSEYAGASSANAAPPAVSGANAEARAPVSAASGLLSMTLRALAALSFIIAVILVLGYLARKFGKRTPLLSGQQFGEYLGKVHLTPRAALHYIKTGDRILVVGLTQTSIAPIAELPIHVFEREQDAPLTGTGSASSFLRHLRAAAADIAPAESTPEVKDEDILSLRGDVQRLQRYIEESHREEI